MNKPTQSFSSNRLMNCYIQELVDYFYIHFNLLRKFLGILFTFISQPSALIKIKQYSRSSFKSKKLLKIQEDKIFIFITNLREQVIYPVCEIISSQSFLLLKRRQFQTLQSTFLLLFLLWCVELKKRVTVN